MAMKDLFAKLSKSGWMHAGGAGGSLGLLSLIGVCGGVCSASAIPVGLFLASFGLTGAALWLDAIRVPLLTVAVLFCGFGIFNLVKRKKWVSAAVFAGVMGLGLIFSVKIAFYPQVTKSVPLSEITPTDGNSDDITTVDVESYRSVFNRDSNKLRIVTLLSPVCGGCVNGLRTYMNVFKAVPSSNMVGHVVWLPMLKKDNFEAAEARAKDDSDSRVTDFWDPNRAVGNAFTPTLKLDRTAWDIYLVYEPGVIWEEGMDPPNPAFWMHQLWGVSKVNFLNEAILIEKVKNIIAPIDGA